MTSPPTPHDDAPQPRPNSQLLSRLTDPQRRRVRHISLLVLLLALPVQVLHWVYPGGFREWLSRAPAPGERDAERAASLDLVAGLNVHGQPIVQFCRQRCHVLVSTPTGEPAVKVLRRGDGVLETEIGRFHATCAQVTADGYLLTAGHCLPADRDLHVSIHGFRDGLRKARTVKVWGKPIDLALLKIDSPGPAWFPLGPAEVADRDLVISAGLRPVSFSIRLQTDDLVGVRLVTEESPVDVTAGHAVKVEPFTRQTGFRQLTTTMPLVPGNSGGAVIDASGRLLAINTRMDKVPPAILGKLLAQESHAYATLLDPAEVESAIEEDRRHGN